MDAESFLFLGFNLHCHKNMTETKIYVGLNDALTRLQQHNTETYVDVMKYVCKSHHVSFSFVITEGGFFHEDGAYTQEQTLVLSLIDADRQVTEAIAKDLCAFFHQEYVMITESMVNAYYIKDDLKLK
jgi:hypothetical protein